MYTKEAIIGAMYSVTPITLYRKIAKTLEPPYFLKEEKITKKDFFINEIRGNINEFHRDFERVAESVPDGRLVVYRCVAIKDLDELYLSIVSGVGRFDVLDYAGIGIYWSWDSHAADCHWADFSEGERKVYLKGIVDYSSIDISYTVTHNVHPDWLEEREIRLKNGGAVEVVEIFRMSDEGKHETIDVFPKGIVVPA